MTHPRPWARLGSFVGFAFLFLLTLAVSPRGAQAQDVAAPESVRTTDGTVTLDVREMPITKVLELFMEQRGLNIVASEAVTGKVTVRLERVPWEEALAAVLKTRGLSYQKLGTIIQVDAAEKLAPLTATRVFPLQHLSLSEVREMVKAMLSQTGKLNVLERAGTVGGPGGSLVVTDAPGVLAQVESLLSKVDVPSPSERLRIDGPDSRGLYSAEIRNVPFGRVFEELRRRFGINILEDSPIQGRLSVTVKDVGEAQLLDSILGANPLRYLQDGKTYRVAPVEQFRERIVTRVFTLRYVDAADVKRFLTPHVTSLGKVEVFARQARAQFAFGTQSSSRRPTAQQASAPQRSNTIAVTDTPAAVENISALIEKLDIRPRQICIDVKIVEVTLKKNETLGIDWKVDMRLTGASQPTRFPFNTEGPAGTLANNTFRFGTLSAQDFTGVLQFLEARNRLKIVSSPRISTLNNQEASILVGNKFPITVETIDPQTAVRTITLDHYEQIGVQLLVVPQISGTDSLNLIIHPAVSTIGEIIDQRFPVIATREADTQVLVKNGDTAVIGGLLQERTNSTKTGVPGLRELPVVGRLFEQTSNSSETVDLLIFVTPTIVPETVLGLPMQRAPGGAFAGQPAAPQPTVHTAEKAASAVSAPGTPEVVAKQPAPEIPVATQPRSRQPATTAHQRKIAAMVRGLKARRQ